MDYLYHGSFCMLDIYKRVHKSCALKLGRHFFQSDHFYSYQRPAQAKIEEKLTRSQTLDAEPDDSLTSVENLKLLFSMIIGFSL